MTIGKWTFGTLKCVRVFQLCPYLECPLLEVLGRMVSCSPDKIELNAYKVTELLCDCVGYCW